MKIYFTYKFWWKLSGCDGIMVLVLGTSEISHVCRWWNQLNWWIFLSTAICWLNNIAAFKSLSSLQGWLHNLKSQFFLKIGKPVPWSALDFVWILQFSAIHNVDLLSLILTLSQTIGKHEAPPRHNLNCNSQTVQGFQCLRRDFNDRLHAFHCC